MGLLGMDEKANGPKGIAQKLKSHNKITRYK